MRPRNDKLSATLGRDGILTQVCYIPNSCCFHYNRLLPRGLLMTCYLPETSYYISFILHSNICKVSSQDILNFGIQSRYILTSCDKFLNLCFFTCKMKHLDLIIWVATFDSNLREPYYVCCHSFSLCLQQQLHSSLINASFLALIIYIC